MMSSRSSDADMLYARRLQDQERELLQQRLEKERQDAEFARRLSQQQYEIPQPLSSPKSNDDNLLIHMGQQASVRLHNPLTGSLIGEVFECKYIDSTTMAFELKKRPGLRLRISDKGKVEFSDKQDLTTLFAIELVEATGPLYIICKAHVNKINSAAERIWYLSLNSDCQLMGNGARNANSQWVLVSAGDNSSPRSNSKGGYQSVLPHNFQEFHSEAFLSQMSMTTTTTVATNAHGARSKDYKRDESAINAQLQWLATAAGQAYLNELSPAARVMYSDGTLKRILHRPDWPRVAERWKDYAKLAYPVNRQFAEQYLTHHHRHQFFEQGYCVIQDVIHPELLNNARKLAMFWAGRYPEDRTDLSSEHAGCKLSFNGIFSTDCDFLALFYETVIVQVVEILIGEGNCTAPQLCDVVLSYPSLLEPAATLDGTGWTIDGFTNEGDHSPYNLLIGIALTDIGEYCGGVSVFPTSQVLLKDYMIQQFRSRSTVFSSAEPNPQKPFLTHSSQVVLKAGDVFLCTQKLARQDVPNSSDVVTGIVYFKIANINHESMKDDALEAVWYEFKGAAEFMEPGSPTAATYYNAPQSLSGQGNFDMYRRDSNRFFPEGGPAGPVPPLSSGSSVGMQGLSRTGSFRNQGPGNGLSRTGSFRSNQVPPPQPGPGRGLGRPPSIMELMSQN